MLFCVMPLVLPALHLHLTQLALAEVSSSNDYRASLSYATWLASSSTASEKFPAPASPPGTVNTLGACPVHLDASFGKSLHQHLSVDAYVFEGLSGPRSSLIRVLPSASGPILLAQIDSSRKGYVSKLAEQCPRAWMFHLTIHRSQTRADPVQTFLSLGPVPGVAAGGTGCDTAGATSDTGRRPRRR
ncbi:hypothetical protein HPB50_004018 [Hyalomma asiaticum]|uniref:Uncharacterized protein n=1 Tax=Hyalomma asiaticum TaxID=266040 RepID=A0ACB7SRI6_HYAAI|nr:hypothetical protein HPB50_004018 [Hyalomma asiaticum]